MLRKSIGIGKCELIEGLVKKDERGILTIIDSSLNFPFTPRRMFYVHEPKGKRGEHAHKYGSECIFVLSGSLTILVDDGRKSKSIRLINPHEGIYLPPMIWSEQSNFSSNCIYAVLACGPYDEPGYIRSRQEFDRITQ